MVLAATMEELLLDVVLCEAATRTLWRGDVLDEVDEDLDGVGDEHLLCFVCTFYVFDTCCKWHTECCLETSTIR